MKDKTIVLTDEARHALRCQGPTRKQLVYALNGYDLDSIPSSRHLRWMAAKLLQVLWGELPDMELKVPRA